MKFIHILFYLSDLAFAFLVVIPAGNLLLPFPASSAIPHPRPKEAVTPAGAAQSARPLHAMAACNVFIPVRATVSLSSVRQPIRRAVFQFEEKRPKTQKRKNEIRANEMQSVTYQKRNFAKFPQDI